MDFSTTHNGFNVETYDIGEDSTEISLVIYDEYQQHYVPEGTYPSTTYENHTQAWNAAFESIDSNTLRVVDSASMSEWSE